jgi:hypothetical protein
MNRFLVWLGLKLFGRNEPPRESLRQTGARMAPKPRPPKPAPPPPPRVDLDTAGEVTIEDGGPGKNILIRNRLVREDTGTHDTLKIISEDVFESREESGLDPYNTGRFDRSKSWDSQNRK